MHTDEHSIQLMGRLQHGKQTAGQTNYHIKGDAILHPDGFQKIQAENEGDCVRGMAASLTSHLNTTNGRFYRVIRV